jgi:hypothetical protein
MKIIGRTETGYLAEMTEKDIGSILGETWLGSSDGKALLLGLGLMRRGSYGSDEMNLVGGTIPVSARFERAVDIERKSAECVKAADTLRALADLLEKTSTIPIVVSLKEPA